MSIQKASPSDLASTVTLTAITRVTPIIVTYNSAHCLPDLQPLLTLCPNVILSDNASDDNLPETARTLLPHATVLQHPRNLGFGAANNRALALVRTEFALLLNPDCTLSAEALGSLVETADRFPDAAIIGPQIYDGKGQAELNYRWVTGSWPSTVGAADGPACVGFLSGAAMLIRMSVAAPQGFFDERFFLYYEDDDLCRSYFTAHLPLVIEPRAQAVHLARRSVRGKSPLLGEYWRGYHHAQSKLTYITKYADVATARRLRRRLVWQTAATLPLRVVLFSPRLIARMWGRMKGAIRWAAPVRD
jgi:N-acetylglucosaminyl-diphospho-decaprenol L-rhamnosyltransferase